MICENCHGTGKAGRYQLNPRPPFTAELLPAIQSITCLACGFTSYNGIDARERYCARCHIFHDDPCPSCGGSGVQYCCEGAPAR